MFINQLLTMGLPAIDDSLMRLLTAMETFPKSAILGSAISFAKMLGLLLALCMGSYECWMMMLGRRGMDVMKLARIIGLSLCITYSSYICESLKMPGKGLEEVTRQMAQSKNKEVAALELKVAQKQDDYLKRLRQVQDSIETAKQVQAIGEDAHWWDKLIYNMENLGSTINNYAQRAAVAAETKVSEWINDVMEAEERRQQQAMIDALTGNTKKKNKKEEKTEIVEKVKDDNSEKFNTVTSAQNVDEPLIKAMIDKTTKAREGTRLRFKLLDDVTVKGIRLKKGSYLYGIVTGFGQQRVMANITSILVGNKFIKVNLSVFDNDGMEGFYVPESTFREMMKDAGSNVAAQNIQFDVNGTGGVSPEIIALQALQNMYQSASSAVSKNIRKNKAKIKYNTIVYLINTQNE